MQLSQNEHKIIDAHYFELRSPVRGERWSLEVPDQVRGKCMLIRTPEYVPAVA